MSETLTPIWRFEDYINLSQHPSDVVHRWVHERWEAIDCLREIETPESVAEWLQDENDAVAASAARLLSAMGAKEYAPALADRLEAARGDVAAACAEALARLDAVEAAPKLMARLSDKEDPTAVAGVIRALGQLRTEDAHAALRALAQANDDPWYLPSLTDSLLNYLSADDVELIVEKYLSLVTETPDRRALLQLMRDGAAVGDVYWHLESMLQDKKGRLTDVHGEAGRAAKRLGLFARGIIKGLLETGKYPQAISRIAQDAKKVSVGPSPYRRTLGAFIQAFEQNLSRLPEDTLKETSLLVLACLIRLLEEAPEWSAHDPTDRLLEILHYDGEFPLENELIEKVLPSRGSEVVEPLLDILKQKEVGSATLRAVGALGRMREARAVPSLLEYLKGDDDFVNETCTQALEDIGSPVLSQAEAVLRGDDVGQKISLVSVLAKLPFEETVDLLLGHYETLVRETPDMLLSALEDLGSRRAAPLVERDIGKGERIYDDTFLLLCELHGVKHPMLGKLRAEQARWRQRDEAFLAKFEEGGFEKLLMEVDEPFHLKLECRACGRSYTYDIEEIFVSPEVMKRKEAATESAFFLREHIICKNCGAEDEYRLTGEAMAVLTVETMRLTMIQKRQGDVPPEDQRLKIVDFRLMDGTRCTPREALDMYKRRIEAEPNNPDLHDRIGCVYRLWRRYDEALTHFQRAMELDPERVATLFHLAELYREMGQEKTAIQAMEDFLNRAARKPKLTREEREYFEATKEMFGLPDDFEEIRLFDPRDRSLSRAKATQARGGLTPTVKKERVSKERISLNAPCPCGSGKKYKRCCARAGS